MDSPFDLLDQIKKAVNPRRSKEPFPRDNKRIISVKKRLESRNLCLQSKTLEIRQRNTLQGHNDRQRSPKQNEVLRTCFVKNGGNPAYRRETCGQNSVNCGEMNAEKWEYMQDLAHDDLKEYIKNNLFKA